MYYDRTAKQMSESPRDLKDFESKFDCRIEESNKYRQHVRRVPYHFWDGKLPLDAELQIVPMKAIHISSENLERLIAEQDRAERWQEEAEYAKRVLSNLRADERVRDDNPAVAKAYRNYLTLLELCRK